ncbi:MAG: response regulator transcription factor [Calditrichaeota bacterium]|nr:response regulator transcription factor [Calditrichota bacterium]
MAKILIIEDDKNIRMALTDDLEFEGYEVEQTADGKNGLSRAQKEKFDLIILDIMLPEMNGFDVCRELRKTDTFTPILMLTAKSEEIDKILGLELGADDYVTKPFSPRELLARVKALLRRSKNTEREIACFYFGDIELDFKKYSAKKGGESIYFTALEFSLLHFLVKHKNEVITRDQLLDAIWGSDVYVTQRTVDTHIANLRKKIENDPAKPKYIVGVRGVGYMLAVEQ